MSDRWHAARGSAHVEVPEVAPRESVTACAYVAPMRTRTRLILSTVVGLTLIGGLVSSPVQADQPVEWLFVMQQKDSSLVTKDGKTGTLTLAPPKVLAFSDRPNRIAKDVSTRWALKALGFTSNGTIDSAPNAALTFSNDAAIPLEITRASVNASGKVTLKVKALGRPLIAGTGISSLFIDNAGPYTPATQLTANLGITMTVLPGNLIQGMLWTGGQVIGSFSLSPQAPAYVTQAPMSGGVIVVAAGTTFQYASFGQTGGGWVTIYGDVTDSGGTYNFAGQTLAMWPDAV